MCGVQILVTIYNKYFLVEITSLQQQRRQKKQWSNEVRRSCDFGIFMHFLALKKEKHKKCGFGVFLQLLSWRAPNCPQE